MVRVITAACVLTTLSGVAFGQAFFQGLERHDTLAGLSADGGTAVGWTSQYQALIWRRGGGWEEFSAPAGFQRVKFTGVSADGRYASGHAWGGTNGMQQAFRFEYGVGFQMLDDLGPPGDRVNASGDGISRDGSTVIGLARIDGVGGRAVRWRSTTPEILHEPPAGAAGNSSWATNVDGSKVVVFQSLHSHVWEEGGAFTTISPQNLAYALPNAMSDDGSVVAGGSYAWRWTAVEGFQRLPEFNDGRGAWLVEDMNAEGTILAGGRLPTNVRAGVHDAFYWTEATGTRYVHEVLQDYGVDMTGWTLTRVQGLSADGKTLIGEGLNPQGRLETWYAFIPQPLPAPGVVGVFGLAGVVVMRRRR